MEFKAGPIHPHATARIRPLGLSAAFVVALAACGPGADDEPTTDLGGGKELVFRWERALFADGHIEDHTIVDTLLEDIDDFDPRELVDREGRQYRIRYSIAQDSIDAPVIGRVDVVREEPDGDVPTPGAFASTPPPAPISIHPEVQRWREGADHSDTIDVLVSLRDAGPPLQLPKSHRSIGQDEPAFVLRSAGDRSLAIESRKATMQALQAAVTAEIEAHGGVVGEGLWLINAFHATLSPEAFDRLADDPQVSAIDHFTGGGADTDDLLDLRTETHADYYKDFGGIWGGEAAPGHPEADGIRIAIIDSNFDTDHPAWLHPDTGLSRLVAHWYWTGSKWKLNRSTNTVSSSLSWWNHGTLVAGVAAGYSGPYYSDEPCTGYAPKAELVFIDYDAGSVDAIQKAVAEEVDVIIMARTDNGEYSCDLHGSAFDAVDAAMLDGIFFAKSAGSGASGSPCNVGNPAAASGAFVATAYDPTGPIRSNYGKGPDVGGRSIVALAAPRGPLLNRAATPNQSGQPNGQYGSFSGTSTGTAQVGGAAAQVKEAMHRLLPAAPLDAEAQYAMMLLMGDGHMGSAAPAVDGEAPDGAWGAGRMRLKLPMAITDPMDVDRGMSPPFRFVVQDSIVSDGRVTADVWANDNGAGGNDPLPSGTAKLKVGVYWHEPNIGRGTPNRARILARACPASGTCVDSTNADDQHQRFSIVGGVAGTAWTLEFDGQSVPPSYDTTFMYMQRRRRVFTALYWEG